MKIILNVLITVGFIVCEVPPPYPPRGFRPSPPFNLPLQNFNKRPQPQTAYGPPNATPSKLLSSPQVQYGAPNTGSVESLGIQSNSASKVSPSFNPRPTIPSTSYGVPITDSSRPLQNNIRIVNSQPQTTYGAPTNLNNNLNKPQTQYGVPDTRNIEDLEQIRQVNLLLQLRQSSKSASQNSQYQSSNNNIIPTEQYLPVRDAANFRDGFSQSKNVGINLSQSQNSDRNAQEPTQQYLPARVSNNFRQVPQVPVVNIPQRQIQTVPNNNFLLSQTKPGLSSQQNDQNNGIPASQYQPSQSTIPQRQIQTASDANLYPNKPVSGFQQNNQNGIPTSQYQPAQSNRFNNNKPNGNNAGGLSQQYVPSVPSSNFQPTESKSNNFDVTSQNSPRNFALKKQQPNFSNGNFNNFGGDNAQSNFEIQQADVRALSQLQGNRNSNVVPTQTQFARPNLRPTEPNVNIGRPKLQDADRESADEKYLPPTTTARAIHRQLNRPRPTEAPVQVDEQSPEPDEETGGPNISVATAVAGAPQPQSFYVLQPDGRLQRVTYQKTREEGDQENEYTANYLFQNIQANPALVYSPLITLTK